MISENKMRVFIQEEISSYAKLADDMETARMEGKVSDEYASTVIQSTQTAIATMRLFLEFYEQRLELGLLQED